MPDLDDLQYERTKWSFLRSGLGSHALSFLLIQEAARRWADRPVTITASCVGPTKTKVMLDPKMPVIMRILGMIGTKPEILARNAVTTLVKSSVEDAKGAVLRKPEIWTPTPLAFDPAKAAANKGINFRRTCNSCYARDSRMCYGWRQRNHRPFKARDDISRRGNYDHRHC